MLASEAGLVSNSQTFYVNLNCGKKIGFIACLQLSYNIAFNILKITIVYFEYV